jgi:D-alanine--D-alanine ligase
MSVTMSSVSKITKLRVAVLMGGKSLEREVSFNSGRTVCDHLDISRYEVIPLFQKHTGELFILPYRFLHRGKISDFEHRLETEAQKVTWDSLKTTVDFVYIAVHGRYAEDGTLQGMLELLQIPYLGSKVFASALSMNKQMQMQILKSAGFDVPRGVYVQPYQLEQETIIDDVVQKLCAQNVQFPVVVKPSGEGSSLGVTVVKTQEDLFDALVRAVHVNATYKQTALVEEKLEGMEFCCVAIADKNGQWISLPPTEVVLNKGTEFFDYQQKYMPGRAIRYTPARTDDATIRTIQETCARATEILEMKTVSRIDGMVTRDGRIVLFDPNALSGMGPSGFLFKQAAQVGMNHTTLINHLIEVELAATYAQKVAVQEHRMHEQTAQKIKVGVLLGGRSHERETSLDSGRNVVYKLSPHKYEVIPLFVNSKLELYALDNRLLISNTTREIEEGVTSDMYVNWSDLPHKIDFAFIGLHGGEGEDGTIQGALEMLGIPYNGSSVLASALCMDKYKTNNLLHANGFAVPQSYFIQKDMWASNNSACVKQAELIGYPLIVKPHDDGCSVMVAKVYNQEQLVAAITTVLLDGKIGVLVEEFVVGMELTVGVLGNDEPMALIPSQAVCAGDILTIEEKFLPGAGENQTPPPLSPEAIAFVRQEIVKTFTAVGCRGYARIDCFYQDALISPTGAERLVILEINTLPGLTPATCIFHQAAELGMKPMEFIDKIVILGLQEHGKHELLAQVSLPSQTVSTASM